MEQLSLLQKIYLYGETLSSNELNQIVLYLNSSIEAINTLIAKNNSINEGHCEMRFKVSTQLPNAPASGSDGTSDGWSDTYTMPDTANGECSWMTLSFFNGDGVYGAWSTPVCITWGSIPGLRGPKGESGVRGSFKSRVFKRLNSKPATPTGGTYDNPFPTSGGWHDGIPSGLAIIWSSVCTFYGNGLSSGWTEPAAESDTDTLDIEFSPSSVQPDPPIGSTPFANHESEGWYDPSSANFSNVGVMIWRAERKVSNGVYNGNWTITRIVGEKGAKGDSGDDGGHYKFRYCNFTPTPGHTTPTKPTQGSDGVGTFGSGVNAATWAISVSDPNVNAGEYTYMTSCYVEGDEYGTWDYPIRITGGEGMAGEDGSDIEFIYTINNTGNIPDAPTASGLGNARIFTEDDWYGKDENGIIWTDNPTGISLENQYEYVAIREKSAGRGSSWSPYKVALWAKWGDKGQDGDGFEYIFLLSQEGDPSQIANPTPQNWSNLSSDYQTMNEYAAYLELHIPVGELYWWTDEPQSITSIYPYVYVSKRTKKLNGEGANATIPGVEATKMVWGPFSAPSLWCRYASLGSTGAHYEFRYCNFKPHAGQTKPTTPTTGSNGRGYFGSDSNTYGGYWGDSAADPDVEHKEYTYMTQCIFTPVEEGNSYYGEWSEPVRITGANGEPGADGTDIEFIYCQYGPNVWSNPVAPTVSDDATIAMDDWPNVDGHTPSKTINGITWFDNPQGVNESNHKYEYMCQRIKPKGSLSWEPYNTPIIWSAYGEKGQDGDSFEYIYYLQDSLTPPDNPTPQDWYENTNYQNNNEYASFLLDWSDDPQSVAQNNRYLFVCKRQKTYNSTYNKVMWHQFSSPSLWARYSELGEAGGHYEFRYCNYTPSTNHETPTKPSDNNNGIGTYGTGVDASTWTRAVLDPDVNNGEFTYMSQCYVTPGTPNDTYGTWTDPVRITGALGERGADGSDIEFIYTRKSAIWNNPTAPTISDDATIAQDDWPNINGSTPSKTINGTTWTDNPLGVDGLGNKYEYMCVRYKNVGSSSWSAYSNPVIWSSFGENGMDGDGYEYIFKHFEHPQTWANSVTNTDTANNIQGGNDNPNNWATSLSDFQNRDFCGPSGHTWSDDPQGISSTYLYEYVSTREYKLWPGETEKRWGTFSVPTLWSNYALASDGGNYEFRYTNTSNSSPTKPTTGSDGIGSVGSGANAVTWSRTPATLSSSDIKGGIFTYMTYCFKFGDGTYGEWSTPVRITGANGEDGADGADIEFIYTRNNTGTVPYAPTSSGSGNTKVFSADDWFGLDNYGITWTDNPTGVEQNMRYEYVAVREKPTGINQSWGAYTVALWSKYGEKGMDGDGYEYIYKTFANKVTSWDSSDYTNPKNWPTVSESDYTGPWSGKWPSNSSLPVADYRWSDDPLEVDDTNNKYLYMSVRKRTNGAWGTFTEPKLWNNYAEAGATVPGPPGDIGPMSYLAGIWNSSVTYTKTSRLNPVVYYPTNDSYYYLKDVGSSTGDNPAGTGMTYTELHPNPWLQAENYNMVFTDILFVNQFAKLGSFIVNQDWMLCQYGTIYDYGTGIHPILNATDSIAVDAETTYTYLNAYLLFDPAYPDKRKPNNWNFVPNYAINAVTGEIFCNNAHITGEVTATSGTFTGVVNASGGVFNGIVNATQFKAGDDNGFSITTSPDSLDFNYNGNRLAFFSLRSWDATNNQLADVSNNPTGFYLYMTNPLNGHLITINFNSLSFKDLNENQVVRHEATFYRLSNLNGKAVETPVTLYYSLENNTTKWWLHSDSATELTSSEMGTLYKKQQVNQRGVGYSACVQEVDAGTPYITTNYTLYELQTLQNNVPTKTGNYAMATHLNTNGSSSTDYWFVVPNSTTLLDSLNTNWSAVFLLNNNGSVNSTTATTVIRSSNHNTVPTFNSAVSFISRIEENGDVGSILYPTPTLNF